jgi:putative DNA primase/helicase
MKTSPFFKSNKFGESAEPKEEQSTPPQPPHGDRRAADWADPQPLHGQLRPVEKLRPEMIPEPLRKWVVDVAYRMSCP